jgi:Zinc-binding dehydrogenase
VVLYSIQWLERLKPAFCRRDLSALFDLLQQKKIKPLVARRFPLTEARQAQELLGKGGVVGKLVRDSGAWSAQPAREPYKEAAVPVAVPVAVTREKEKGPRRGAGRGTLRGRSRSGDVVETDGG